eukprot:scaffold2101_cov127-Cylindrotheca_fusiformis.AAC.2
MSINFDELVSLESESAGKAENPTSQLPPSSPNSPCYNLVGLTVRGVSPRRRSLSSDFSAASKNQAHHSVNAVHMHIQENAKIPTLQHSIDRSNSTRPSFPTNPKAHDNYQQDSGAVSMAELFLRQESSHRRSLEQNYESLGSLLSDVDFDGKIRQSGDDGMKVGNNTVALDESQIEIDALAAAVDPTPWSEIEKKIHNDEGRPGETTRKRATSKQHPHQSNYYPYGRNRQLPLPAKTTTPDQRSSTTSKYTTDGKAVESPTMAEAIATAAAIVSTQTETPGPQLDSSKHLTDSSSRQPSLYPKAQQSSAGLVGPAGSSQHYHHRRATYKAPQHSAAHTTTRASVLAAANKKSQYGFGGNHTVPSVPAPPPMTNGTFSKSGATRPRSHSAIPHLPHGHVPPPNSGAAYERKKQRAKDARVKLNEAIEKLSVAISLAGSQSKQRNQFLGRCLEAEGDRAMTLQTSAKCSNLAETAKKWDRPSFVNTAASMVLELNAQCEALTREIVVLQEGLDAVTKQESTNCDSLTSHPEHKRHENPVSSVDDGDRHNSKRVRPNSTTPSCKASFPTLPGDAKTNLAIFRTVRDFLDPISLARCSSVSRRWRDMGIFDDNGVWLNLAVKRFGFENIERWIERHEVPAEDVAMTISKKQLFRLMDSENVMPHCKKENVCLLGGSKIPGKVSGWVFMVERSNGETLRSVTIQPGDASPANGIYQSQPVVELKIIIQNTGMANHPVVVRNQQISVDVSTRRTGGELMEITWDDRFSKVLRDLNGAILDFPKTRSKYNMNNDLSHLNLFDAVMIDVFINARGCSTTSKFKQRSNSTKLVVSLDGVTVPLVIPFHRDQGIS